MGVYTLQQQEAALRLFKGYIVVNKDLKNVTTDFDKGLIIEGNIREDAINNMLTYLYYNDGKKFNQTFHKSFENVENKSIKELIGEQLIHYFTTYGFDALGIYDKDLVYIPKEELNIPEITEDIKFIVIHNFSEDEIQEKVLNMLTSGIALSKETLKYLQDLSDFIPKEKIYKIKNREFSIYLYDKYKTVPKDPDMFLKYLLYKGTGSTQVIFNEYKFNHNLNNPKGIKIKRVNSKLFDDNDYVILKQIQECFNSFISQYNDENDAFKALATCFNKYRTVFLTIKAGFKQLDNSKYGTEDMLKVVRYINKISKYSKNNKRVNKDSILNNIFQYNYSANDIKNELKNLTIFRELRLLNYIKKEQLLTSVGRPNDAKILYRIRNGKVFVRSYELDNKFKTLNANEYYDIVKSDLIKRLCKKLENKSFYIPDNLFLTVPTSEKQFLGEIPNKSYITIPREDDLVIGIHWYNLPKERVDLDLHMVNKDRQFGWNTEYKSENNDIVYSGDMTDAILPNGASEYFLIKQSTNLASYLLTVNNFNNVFNGEGELDYEFIVARRHKARFKKDYCVNPNDIIIKINRKMYKRDGNQICLGLLDVSESKINFCFTDFDMGFNNITRRSDSTSDIYLALKQDLNYKIDLKSLLISSGMRCLHAPYEEKFVEMNIDGKTLYEKKTIEVDYNLSLENLTKDTLINLLKDE